MSTFEHPWEYPDCPECETELYVTKHRGDNEGFTCKNCDAVFCV